MAQKIKLLVQKRTSLKTQITSLENLLGNEAIDNTNLRLRSTRLTTLYHAFEDHHDKLIPLDSNKAHLNKFDAVQECYYNLIARIENKLSGIDVSEANTSRIVHDGSSDVAITNKKRRLKLPEAKLPMFDGSFENWLSFFLKNAFKNIIDSQADLSDIDKLDYLKSTLIGVGGGGGDAASKIEIFVLAVRII